METIYLWWRLIFSMLQDVLGAKYYIRAIKVISNLKKSLRCRRTKVKRELIWYHRFKMRSHSNKKDSSLRQSHLLTLLIQTSQRLKKRTMSELVLGSLAQIMSLRTKLMSSRENLRCLFNKIATEKRLYPRRIACLSLIFPKTTFCYQTIKLGLI